MKVTTVELTCICGSTSFRSVHEFITGLNTQPFKGKLLRLECEECEEHLTLNEIVKEVDEQWKVVVKQ